MFGGIANSEDSALESHTNEQVLLRAHDKRVNFWLRRLNPRDYVVG